MLLIAGLIKSNSDNRQPMHHVLKIIKESGNFILYKEVAIELERHFYKRELVGSNPLLNFLRKIEFTLTRNGYDSKNLILSSIFIFILFSCIYQYSAENGGMAPSNPIVIAKYGRCCGTNWYFCEQLPEEITGLSPIIYSLDTMIPIVDLQQSKDWGPVTKTPHSFNEFRKYILDFFNPGTLTRFAITIQTLYGWIASVFFLRILTERNKYKIYSDD